MLLETSLLHACPGPHRLESEGRRRRGEGQGEGKERGEDRREKRKGGEGSEGKRKEGGERGEENAYSISHANKKRISTNIMSYVTLWKLLVSIHPKSEEGRSSIKRCVVKYHMTSHTHYMRENSLLHIASKTSPNNLIQMTPGCCR